MLREQARDGMRVYFGRQRGEKSLGRIIKANPSRAKVELLEERGTGRSSTPGSTWVVPYSLMEPADESAAPGSAPVVKREKLEFNPFQPAVEVHILLAIAACYGDLSPENLSADGELPRYEVQRRYGILQRQLRGLKSAFGRDVDEMEVYEWVREYEAHQREREQRRVANSR